MKQALVKQITGGAWERSLENTKLVVQERLGDLTAFGIDLNAANSLPELTKLLEKKLAREHTIDEVKQLVKDRGSVRRGRILSVAPSYLYEEPCVVITGIGSNGRQAIFEVAEAFRQARFTFESVTAREITNVVLPAFASEVAAK